LTGRLPLHHSEFLSGIDTGDDIDLRWTTIAQKVKSAGYMAFWYGKGHTGYKSYNHLPLQLGFDDYVGFLGGAEDHFTGPRWSGNCPQDPKNGTYSARLFGQHALATLQAYDPAASDAKPLFFYLPWQNVHAPYQVVDYVVGLNMNMNMANVHCAYPLIQ
jgi:arylsulfatase A-like enzyme